MRKAPREVRKKKKHICLCWWPIGDRCLINNQGNHIQERNVHTLKYRINVACHPRLSAIFGSRAAMEECIRFILGTVKEACLFRVAPEWQTQIYVLC